MKLPIINQQRKHSDYDTNSNQTDNGTVVGFSKLQAPQQCLVEQQVNVIIKQQLEPSPLNTIPSYSPFVTISENGRAPTVDAGAATRSPVEQFFYQSTIFITGGSGFIGKVLLEKLLRCYPDINHIYVLLRTKRNTGPHDRLHGTIFNAPLFDTLKRLNENIFSKVTVIPGDISQPRLGISREDEERLIKADVSIIFHSAATVKFDEPLKKSINLNLVATRSMLDLAHKFPKLVSFCHVSTAYANSDIYGCEIKERIYPMTEKPSDIIGMAKWMNEDTMQVLKSHLLRNRPNTYTYTKAMTEILLIEEAQDLPLVIVRPSIVTATWRDPFRGWVDNVNGPTGLLLACGKGLIRTLNVSKKSVADLIPADVCINLMIAAAWKISQERTIVKSVEKDSISPGPDGGEYVAKIYGDNDKNLTSDKTQPIMDPMLEPDKGTISDDDTEKHPPIYHCTSGKLNPITWGEMENFLPIIRTYPSEQVFRYPNGSFKENRYVDSFIRIFVHFFPALLIDILCICTGNKPILLSVYNKIYAAINQLQIFCNNGWNFNSDNMLALYEELDPRDRAILHMDIRQINWHTYFHDYALGARTYVLKEDTKSLPKARRSLKRAYYIHLVSILLILAIIWYFIGSPITSFLI